MFVVEPAIVQCGLRLGQNASLTLNNNNYQEKRIFSVEAGRNVILSFKSKYFQI